MILLNGLFPVILLIVLGIFLKRINLTNDVFLKTSDRLVYFIFFPVMLFWKIGGASIEGDGVWQLCYAVISAVVCMFFISIAVIRIFSIRDFQAGSFAQSCYRFNTYIGVAIILGAIGEVGVAYFGMVIGLVIPLINVAAVTTLIWYSAEKRDSRQKVTLTCRALISNPLILGCLSGIVYGHFFSGFPQFIDHSLRLLSMVTLPLALISIGGSLTFAGLRQHCFPALAAALIKLGIFPLVGWAALLLFGVDEDLFGVGMIFFCLPTSTAIYVLSGQLNSDTDLASAAIVTSTLLSFPVLAAVLYYLS